MAPESPEFVYILLPNHSIAQDASDGKAVGQVGFVLDVHGGAVLESLGPFHRHRDRDLGQTFAVQPVDEVAAQGGGGGARQVGMHG